MKLFGKNTMMDDLNKFNSQYQAIKFIIFKYLKVNYEQLFYNRIVPDYLDRIPEVNNILAAEVTKYLLAQEYDEKFYSNNSNAEICKKIASECADVIMSTNQDFCKLLISSLKMENLYQSFIDGNKWFEQDGRGQQAQILVEKYGSELPAEISQEDYDKIAHNWRRWYEQNK